MYMYLYIHLLVIPCVLSFNSLINVDEIYSVHYNINILSTPVLQDQGSAVETIKLINKHGQAYVCDIPAIQLSTADIKKVDEKSEEVTDIAELLVPMEEGPCLAKKIHWWTYEFCYASIIKQYHVEENKVLGPIIILGQYESEYNWKNNSEAKNKLKKFHTQYYVNGTRCDVNGKHRKTEVRFHCDNGANDYIRQVDEPESCRYVMIIGTSRVCHHPFLKSPPKKAPYKLNCSPTVTAEELEKYQEVIANKVEKAKELQSKNTADKETENVPKIDKTDDPANNEASQVSSEVNKKEIYTKENNPKMETEPLPIQNKQSSKDKLQDIFGQRRMFPDQVDKANSVESSFRKVLETIKEEMETYRNELNSDYLTIQEANAMYFKDNMRRVKRRLDTLSKKENDSGNTLRDINSILDKMLETMVTLVNTMYPTNADDTEILETSKVIKKMILRLIIESPTIEPSLREERLKKNLLDIVNILTIPQSYNEEVISEMKNLETDLKQEIEYVFNPDKNENGKSFNEISESLDLHLFDEALARGDITEAEIKTMQHETRLQILKDEKKVQLRKMELEQRIKERLKKKGLFNGHQIEIQIFSPTYMTDKRYPSLDALSPKDQEILVRIVNANEDEIKEVERHEILYENYNFQLDKILSSEDQPNPDSTLSQLESAPNDPPQEE